MHPRQASFYEGSRIISKAFGGAGSYILDEEAKYVAATAHIWIPRQVSIGAEGVWRDGESTNQIVMRAYTAILNSTVFVRLVSFQSNVLAGGQYDLGKRFVGEVPLPNLWDLASDREGWAYTEELASITDNKQKGVGGQQEKADNVVAWLYGVPGLVEE